MALALVGCFQCLETTSAFFVPSAGFRVTATMIRATDKDDVKVGSKEYYDGFISSGLNDEPRERVTGDAVLGPTFKFVGGFSVVILALLLGFMASNGLL